MRALKPLAALAAAAAVLVAAAAPASATLASATPDDSSQATGGTVKNGVLIGADLFIGGSFTAVDGFPRTRLAALNAASGRLDPTFPVIDVNGTVETLATDGTNLFIGGTFTTVGGQPHQNLAKIGPAGVVDSGFTAAANGTVLSMDVANGVLYVGGKFTAISGTSRKRLAGIDAGTGVVTGFNPKPNLTVYAVKADGSNVFVGGNFTSIAGQPRNYVAEFTDGSLQDYNANLPSDTQVFDIDVANGSVYLATGGHLPSGNSLYATTASGVLRWQVKTDGNLQTVDAVGATIYGGGHFNNICLPISTTSCVVQTAAKKSLKVDDGTGTPSAWASFNTSLGVWDLTTAGGNLYALGVFTKVGTQAQSEIARFAI